LETLNLDSFFAVRYSRHQGAFLLIGRRNFVVFCNPGNPSFP
jgi:hypothetical protein